MNPDTLPDSPAGIRQMIEAIIDHRVGEQLPTITAGVKAGMERSTPASRAN